MSFGGSPSILRHPRPRLQREASQLNPALAAALGHSARGEPLVIRMEKPSVLSKDAPLSGEADQTATLRAPVVTTIPGSALGNFALAANQAVPKNVFVPLARLQEVLGQPGRVNLLVTSASSGVAAALEPAWSLDDAGLRVQKLDPTSQWDIATTRVFLDPAVAGASAQRLSAGAGGVDVHGQ